MSRTPLIFCALAATTFVVTETTACSIDVFTAAGPVTTLRFKEGRPRVVGNWHLFRVNADPGDRCVIGVESDDLSEFQDVSVSLKDAVGENLPLTFFRDRRKSPKSDGFTFYIAEVGRDIENVDATVEVEFARKYNRQPRSLQDVFRDMKDIQSLSIATGPSDDSQVLTLSLSQAQEPPVDPRSLVESPIGTPCLGPADSEGLSTCPQSPPGHVNLNYPYNNQ